MKTLLLTLAAALAIPTLQAAPPSVTTTLFGKLPGGKPVTLYMLTNGDLQISVMDYGATVVNLFTSDRTGQLADAARPGLLARWHLHSADRELVRPPGEYRNS